jgi:hypothetical protein
MSHLELVTLKAKDFVFKVWKSEKLLVLDTNGGSSHRCQWELEEWLQKSQL